MANGEQEETGKGFASFYTVSKEKLPRIPDFSEKMAPPKRSSPFILDDFKGVGAYQAPK